MKLGSVFVLVLLAAATSAGCTGDNMMEDPAPKAQLRVLHATASLGPIDVEVGGVLVAQGIPYGRSSALLSVPTGSLPVLVRVGSQLLGQLEVSLSGGHLNTVVVAAGTPRLAPVIQADTGQPAPNRANLRLVNITGPGVVAPTWLDIRARVPGTPPDSVLTFALDASVSAYWSLMYFDAGHFDFSYLPRDGGSEVAHAAFDIALGEKKALVLERTGTGFQLTVVVEP